MSINAKYPAPPSLVATTWLRRQLVSVIAKFHRRLRKRLMLTSSAIASMTGIGVFALCPPEVSGSGHLAAIDATVLTVTVSIMTAAALYAILRQSEPWLHQATSPLSHDNIDLLSLVGKLPVFKRPLISAAQFEPPQI